MALHIENKIVQYWAYASGRTPRHEPVQRAMSRNRFLQIHAIFYITEKGKNVFEMVRVYYIITLYINYLLNNNRLSLLVVFYNYNFLNIGLLGVILQ